MNDILDYWSIDIDDIKKVIEDSAGWEDDQAFFEHLSIIAKHKKDIKDSLEQLEGLESEIKGLINSRAKALYGPDWQVISGEHFKITRSKTGDMYTIVGSPSPQFIRIKKSVDSKKVEEFIVSNDKLPKGIEINDQRGESLRITVK